MTDESDSNDESLPLPALERIEGVCLRFEAAWKEGQAPRIEDYLGEAQGPERTELLRELLRLDLDYRSRGDEPPTEDEYQERFPRDGKLVCDIFEEVAAGADAQQNAPQQEAETHVPETIGRFRVQRILGKGGFGEVYLAEDPDLGRLVALKVPRPGRFSSEAELDHFFAEARTAAQLDHPGIVAVHDVFRDGERVVIVQQYIEGQDLRTLLKSETLAPNQAAELMAAIAEAVAFAHRKGFVHRDLKPANILLDDEAKPHIADFGLTMHESILRRRRGEQSGTPAYMPPEQVRGETHRLDGRSDIWSLGVILYEMLAGRRPFHGEDYAEVFDEITYREAKPPREIRPELPGELERICLKCIEKRITDRYRVANDLALDLRHWLDSDRKDADKEEPSEKAKVVPKGLRSFGPEDAEFFLDLLPGRRDRDGLPESIRFWKARIEETVAENTFSIGLIYGASGCGKSSLVKAGLLPRLRSHVIPIYVDASATDMEAQLLKGLHRHCADIPQDMSLPELFELLREGLWIPSDQKILVVLDQFEQWLHARRGEPDTQLLQALRHCDGARIQSLFLVRDDFWLATSRFMQGLEVELVEGHNTAMVDLFDPLHARKVLADFGRAYGRLPERPDAMTKDQEAFLDRAIEDLAVDGKVICVRLALFAHLLRGRTWETATLKQLHGLDDLGVTFLEESFSAPSAPAQNRHHEKAARAVLKELLRETGESIRGAMRSYDELLHSSGYSPRPKDFETLLRILNTEIRLITPADPAEFDGHDQPPVEQESRTRYFQLTHDYLVPAIQEWLTRKQKETRRGRAELRLAERCALWGARPENRHLPAWWEYLNIRLFANRQKWTEPQRRMMGKARRVHGLRWGVGLMTVLAIAITVQQMVSRDRHRNLLERVETAVAAMSTSRGILVPCAIEDLSEFPREIVLAELRDRYADGTDSRKLSLAYALAHFGDVRVDYLVSQLAEASSDEASNLAMALKHDRTNALDALRNCVKTCDEEKDWRQKERPAIVALYLEDSSLAEAMCRLGPNPSERTIFIEEVRSFHGDLVKLGELAASIDDPPLRSGLCLGIGSIMSERVTHEEKQAWQPLLADWYQNKPDTGTHSAAGWALRQWNLDLPAIAPSKQPAQGHEWHVNSLGMTMLKIPGGSFRRKSPGPDAPNAIDQRVTLTRSFLLSDREIFQGLFIGFVSDPDYPEEDKPSDWALVKTSNRGSVAIPVQFVNWYDAVLFCNWLSRKEGLQPCYERTGEKETLRDHLGNSHECDVWQVVADANGYRLPTEAEWEHACRAMTTTEYAFGNDKSLLDRYAVWHSERTEICGEKMPNGWGLFDMHGNVTEWCQDWYGSLGVEEAVTDPSGPQKGNSRVLRGRSFGSLGIDMRSPYRLTSQPMWRDIGTGFRLARTHP